MPTEWKFVPVTPTPEMVAANGSSVSQEGREWLAQDARETWAAMLAAAPADPAPKRRGRKPSGLPSRKTPVRTMRLSNPHWAAWHGIGGIVWLRTVLDQWIASKGQAK